MSTITQEIAVGVILNNGRDKVLVSKRLLTSHQGGLWEFPGGKINHGESVFSALKRELREELDILVEKAHPLICIDYDYPDIKVRLNVWIIDNWEGTPFAKESQLLEWTPLPELKQKTFLPANYPILKAVQLPSLYLITPDYGNYDNVFLDRTMELLKCGVKILQFRSKKAEKTNAEKTALALVDICNKFDCKLILNGRPEQAIKVGAHGIHMNSKNLLACNERPLPADQWLGASCHNEFEINQAIRIGADFCVLSPVQKSFTYKNTNVLGWHGFKLLAQKSNIPVFALGGIQPRDMTVAKENSAHGIAMISGIWDAPDPQKAVRECLDRY